MARTTTRKGAPVKTAADTVAVAKTVAGAARESAVRTAATKTTAARTPTKKGPARKASAKQASATQTRAKSTAATNATAKQTPVTAKKAPTKTAEKQSPEKKTAAKKTAAKKTAAKKTAAKKTIAKKAPAKRTTTRRTTGTRTAAGSTGPGRLSTASAAKKLSVKPGEDPWTTAELAEVRGELDTDRSRLRSELNLAEHELHDLMVDAGEGAGNDQADVGSATFERDHEIRIAKNSRDMLEQTERALARIADGSYGICESCGEPIGKQRVMAFPRATLCLSCKQREERR